MDAGAYAAPMSTTLLLLATLALACGAPAPPSSSPTAPPPAAAPPGAGAVAEQPSLEPGSRLVDVAGKVVKVSDEWWGLAPDFDLEGTRFAPDPPLAAELRVDGLRVVFTGVVGEIPPNVRMWGIPLALESVRRE